MIFFLLCVVLAVSSTAAAGGSAPHCVNLGVWVNASCSCPPTWTGDQCEMPVCAHYRGGTGPWAQHPPEASNNQCPDCLAGYDGPYCGHCASSEGCPGGDKCVDTIGVPAAPETTLTCLVTEKEFLHPLGPHRSVGGEVIYRCTSPSNFTVADASCAVSFLRVEPNRSWVDPFFYCTGTQCSAVDTETVEKDPLPTTGINVFRRFRVFAAVVLLVLSLSVALVGVMPMAARLRTRLSFRALPAVPLVLTFVVLILSAVMEAPSSHVARKTLFSCEAASCTCAPDPQNSALKPFCKGSALGKYILPTVAHKTSLSCESATGACAFIADDIETQIELSCTQATCQGSPASHTSFPTPNVSKYPFGTGVAFLAAALSILGALGAHFWWTFQRTQQAIRDFNCELTNEGTIQEPDDASEVEGDQLLPAADPHAIIGGDCVLTARHISYKTRSSRCAFDEEPKTILEGVSFSVRGGDVVALMGASGAGKTTLLDILAARAKDGSVSGQLLLGASDVLSNADRYRNIVGYVAQEDTLLPSLTVREAVTYAARLKLPAAFSSELVARVVDQLLTSLHIQRCADSVIGDGVNQRGISGGEKRRVSIATELVANPRILFLDEPTSGLDASSAMHVVDVIQKLSQRSILFDVAPHFFSFRPVVIASIHQPSKLIFERFSHLILLSNGAALYAGPRAEAFGFLREHAGLVPESDNPAEDIVAAEERLNDQQLAALLAVSASIGGDGSAEDVACTGDVLGASADAKRFYLNGYDQFFLLCRRSARCLVGAYYLLAAHALVAFVMGSLMMVLYREEPLTLPGALNRAGSITFLLLVQALVSLSALDQLLSERRLFVTERENGFYATLPYLLSKIALDIIPLRVVPSVIVGTVIYFPMGLRVDDGAHFLWFLFILSLFTVCVTLMVICVGVVTSSFASAALGSVVIILWNFVFGGLLVQTDTIPDFLQPCRFLSPFFAAFEALLVNELDGQMCTFAPTDAAGRPSSTTIPLFCTQYLYNLGLHADRFPLDVTVITVECGLLTLLAWFLLSRASVKR